MEGVGARARRHVMLPTAVIIVTCLGCAHRRVDVWQPDDVITAQKALIMANNAADVAAVERLTADEWVGVDASGTVSTRSDLRAELTARGPAKVQATAQQLAGRQNDWHVHVYGDVGTVWRLTAGDHGLPAWVTTVWVRRDGRWQRVLSQVTQAPSRR